ncbi:MAG: hypothetical protein JW915_23640 [Chitinispirillaceae bacterium]|nr:hypothetical protein [Chitinispirillaceae bacterium]
MARYYNLTEETFKRLVLDAGKVYKNYTSQTPVALGATRGGSTFTIETEYKDMKFDGAKGFVKGSRRITNVKAILTVNFVEYSSDLLLLALTGAESADYPESPAIKTHDEIIRSLQIALTNYLTDITILGEVAENNNPVVLGIMNPIVDGNFEMAFVDNEEAGLTITFTAHFDPADLETEPWFVRFPVIAE